MLQALHEGFSLFPAPFGIASLQEYFLHHRTDALGGIIGGQPAFLGELVEGAFESRIVVGAKQYGQHQGGCFAHTSFGIDEGQGAAATGKQLANIAQFRFLVRGRKRVKGL